MFFLICSNDSCGCARTLALPGELPTDLEQVATCGCGFPLSSAGRQQLVLGSMVAGDRLGSANSDFSPHLTQTIFYYCLSILESPLHGEHRSTELDFI